MLSNFRTVVITSQLAAALLLSPAFAANDKNHTYLALGDSVAFGLDPNLLPPYTTTLPTGNQFTGYPEIVAEVEDRKLTNTSCPGETSGSFLNVTSLDFGCNGPHYQPPFATIPPFKTFGLRVPYTGDQMSFAEAQLQADKKIDLVTLSIGANNVLLVVPDLLQCQGDVPCVNGIMGPLLQAYAGDLTQILTRIRAQYKGEFVVMKYYSPAPELDGVTVALNDTMEQVVDGLNKRPGFKTIALADGFTAFQLASALRNHNACDAGLLVRLGPPSPVPCDIHPSPTGRDILAATVLVAKRNGK